MVVGFQCRRQVNCLVEPVHGCRHAVAIMGSKPVVGHQQLDSAGRAIRKIPIGGVPGAIGGAKEFLTQRSSQQRVADCVLIIPEIVEFIVLCLKQQHIVKPNIVFIICRFIEELAALQNNTFGRNVLSPRIHSPRQSRRYGPGSPGAHGVSGYAHPAGIHKIQLRK